MPIKREQKEEKPVALGPFNNPGYWSKPSVFGDLEFQRKFDQNFLRYQGSLGRVMSPGSSGGPGGGSSGSSGLPFEPGQVQTGEGEWKDIASEVGIAVRIGCVASATARNENLTERSTSADSYTRVKAIVLGEHIKGTIRVTYYLKTSDALVRAYARLYRNDVALGSAFETILEGGEPLVEDFTVDWSPGDVIHIDAYSFGGGAIATVYDMTLSYNRAIISFGEFSLVTPLPIVEQTPYSVENSDP